MRAGVETLYFAGDGGGEIGGIEESDASYSALASENTLPVFSNRVAKRRNNSQPGDDNASLAQRRIPHGCAASCHAYKPKGRHPWG